MIRELTLGVLAAATLHSIADDAPSWKAMLVPNEGSHLHGAVTVVAVGRDSIRTVIDMSGGEAGKSLAWHIHQGACGTKGPIFGDAKAYPPLTLGKDGTASRSVTLPVALASAGQYSVTVHQSTKDMTPAACGDLKSTSTGQRDSMPPMRNDSMSRLRDSMPPVHNDSMPAMRDSMPAMKDSVKP